jgi:hypothetical protein
VRLKILAILLVSLLIAGCGSAGSTQSVTLPGQSQVNPTQVAVTSGLKFALPASARQNQCEVADGSVQIIFYSRPLKVASICAAQIRLGGWQNGYQTATPDSHLVLFCYLRNVPSTVVASVFDTAEGRLGPKVCRSLISTRVWFDAQAHITLCPGSGTSPALKEPPGTKCP